jgi:hypothetical protein
MKEEEMIDASPTKEFFIEMLTRDIKLEKAILDLIDNSIDGAKNKQTDSENFNGLLVNMTVDGTSFIISDNCGGFDMNTAKHYAFRFGRPESSTSTVKHSVGRFGVGMKRALFKIGKKFTVESKCKDEHFAVDVDVEEWSKKQDSDWSFSFTSGDSLENPLIDKNASDGTVIKVTELYPNIKDEFSSISFISNLKSEIERFMYYSLEKGLSIKLNNVDLKHEPLKILSSENLKPISKEFSYMEDKVKVKIVVGIGEANPDASGWYIYCNDRLVLEKDKTNLTGWEGKIFDESKMVKWHHQYAMFRGLVFFDAEDPRLLPMTTTKIGVDSNSAIYRAVKQEMIETMSQVSNFLKKLKDDTDRDEVTADAEELSIKNIKELPVQKVFDAILPSRIIETNKMVSISYKKEKKIVEKIKKQLGINSNSILGEHTFDYFFKNEIE